MTGFASKTQPLQMHETKVDVTINIKSVNARFFETNCKMPHALFNFETDIIKRLKKQLHRGHVFFSINISDQSAFKGAISYSLPLAESYNQAVEKIQKATGVSGSFTISDLVDLPYLFSVEEQTIPDSIKQELFQLIDQTAQALIAEQEKEGATLEHDLLERAEVVAQKAHKIETLHEAFMARRKKEILDEIHSYNDKDDIIESRKAGLYYILDKIDITEEIVRLKSHLVNLKDLIQSNAIEKGKRLDFTLQELGREINTIAAKCSDAHMGSFAIDMKVEIEKMREQAQNVV